MKKFALNLFKPYGFGPSRTPVPTINLLNRPHFAQRTCSNQNLNGKLRFIDEIDPVLEVNILPEKNYDKLGFSGELK